MAHIYVLDANVFIEAARRYYAFDLAPRFWEELANFAAAGRVCSIDRVMHELLRGRDELAEWAKDTFGDSFVSTDEDDILQAYRGVMAWAQGQLQFTDAARAEFASVADGWLVAYAQARGCIVVTHEQYKPDVKKRILVPNACKAFGVQTVDTFTMLRALGARIA